MLLCLFEQWGKTYERDQVLLSASTLSAVTAHGTVSRAILLLLRTRVMVQLQVLMLVCVAIFIPKCNHEEDKDKEEDAARVVSFLREAFSITTQQRARVRERVRENEREQTWSSS